MFIIKGNDLKSFGQCYYDEKKSEKMAVIFSFISKPVLMLSINRVCCTVCSCAIASKILFYYGVLAKNCACLTTFVSHKQ